MADKKPSEFDALKAIYDALEPLDPGAREKILSSATVMLGIARPDPGAPTTNAGNMQSVSARVESSTNVRPMGLNELIAEKGPKTNDQLITLFAFYREKYQGKSQFSRDDLKPYFKLAHRTPPALYGRDFTKAVSRGWIHEDGDQSYITSRGIESVQTGFSGGLVAKTRLSKLKRKPRKSSR